MLNLQEEKNRANPNFSQKNFRIKLDNGYELDIGQEYQDMRIKDIELSLKAYEIYK